jgi:hypothetical protein
MLLILWLSFSLLCWRQLKTLHSPESIVRKVCGVQRPLVSFLFFSPLYYGFCPRVWLKAPSGC